MSSAGSAPLVYISSSFDQRGQIEEFVRASGAEPIAGEQYLTASPQDLLTILVPSADALVAYITSRQPSAGVLVEIGAALSHGKPVILVLGAKITPRQLPGAIRGLPAMRMPVPGSDVGAQRLFQLLRAPVSPGIQTKNPHRPAAFPETGRANWQGEYEGRVWEQFLRLGADVSGVQPSNAVGQPDFVAWIPELALDLSGPLVVEVAGKLANSHHKLRQLREVLERAGYLLGVLVLDDFREPEWSTNSRSGILLIGFQQLQALERAEFLALLRAGRNTLFHGAWPR